MELFNTTDKYFEFTNEKELERLIYYFNNAYNAEILKSYVTDIWHIIGDFNVRKNGKPVRRDIYFPDGKKPSYFRKNELAVICALVHDNPENLAKVMEKVPSYLNTGISTILLNGFAGETMLEKINASALIEKHDKYYSWYIRENKARYMQIHGIKSSIPHNADMYYENYVFIPYTLAPVYAAVLHQNLTAKSVLSDNAGNGNKVICAENEFITSFPVITGMYAQKLIKSNDYKMGAAAASRILKATTIPDIIPEQVSTASKINVGQYFIPVLTMAIRNSGSDDMAKCVKLAFEHLQSSDPVDIMPNFLPHIKGFKANYLADTKTVKWCIKLQEYMSRYPDKWIDLQLFRDFLFVHKLDESSGCPLNPQSFGKMRLSNTLSGNTIFIDSQRDEIDTELIRAIAAAMYGMGLAELAVDTEDNVNYETPCGNIRKIRLTALGKYAIGLSDKYVAENFVSKDWFCIDPDHLIITSSKESNPYEPLLADIAVQIGKGRYRIDSGSFLKKCQDISDVDKKISFFKEYICDDLTPIWKDFFNDIQSRCYPFTGENVQYQMLRIKDNNKELAKLLTTDPQLRSMILLVEGYRFLIKSDDLNKFTVLMKSKGYLI